MEIPVIDFGMLETEKRSETMALHHQACQKWGFFMIENHGVEKELMEKLKLLTKMHYEENMKDSFFNSETAKSLDNNGYISKTDWESTFFISHRPNSNINHLTTLSQDLRKTMEEYIDQLIKLAEKLSELMCENLGIEKNHIIEAFSGSKGPSVGTKVAMYPHCPRPELIRGLREHTDAGGIVLLLKTTKSALHRVMAMKDGDRLSIATFYNPSGDAIISPASELLLPSHVRFQD
ncbi:1-aminocyclopropane-1-carboxylate oxidase 1 [Sesamum angolense]|uniref:1-aminocyclopropane-1-carboxylate oxidase 1 n=1 Tax=Sesamum angolense TaxID=2727404 RepID=A0AAE2BTA5_9LAMI|nr:1-aminocyclopropane-1-carboxylate oxidase 1 [Sesamum angolense]